MHENVHTIVASTVFLEFFSSQAVQVSTTSSSVPHKEPASDSTVEEAVLDDQSDRGMTLGHALSLNQVKEMSLASVEELQNLAGGADIKGDTLHHSYAMHIVKPVNMVCYDALLCHFISLCFVGLRSCSRQGCAS